MLHTVRHGAAFRPYFRSKSTRPRRRRRVTLIAAFRCYEGAVLCADGQEPVDVPGYGQYRVRVNKLEAQQTGDYELVVGGSGDGDLVDAFTPTLTEAVAQWPRFDDELSTRRAIKRLLIDFDREDVAASHASEED